MAQYILYNMVQCIIYKCLRLTSYYEYEVNQINIYQAANLAGFRASEDPRFEAGIPDFMNGILNFSIHFNVVHRKVDWRTPKMKSLNSMPVYVVPCGHTLPFLYYMVQHTCIWLRVDAAVHYLTKNVRV